MKGRMKDFPIPSSISNKTYGIFEYLAVDITHINKRSCRGYRYIALFVDKATSMTFVQLIKHKDEFLNTLKVMIEENGPHRNTKSVDLRYLQSDYDTAIINEKYQNTYLYKVV
jgi:hypothetical protein